MLENNTLHGRGKSNITDVIITNVNVLALLCDIITCVFEHIKHAKLHHACLAYDSPCVRLGVNESSYIYS